MNVVFLTPYTLSLKMGGFESQSFQIFENLKKLGVNVKWYYEVSSIDKIDILQVMSTDTAMISFIMKAKNAGAKIVLTPMQGSRAISNFYLKIANRLSHIPQLCTSHLLTNRMMGLADYITPLCSFEANRMTEVYGVPKSRITVIPNGINQEFLEGEPVKRDLPFEEYILIVGRIEQNKNQLNLIKACNELNQNLIIVGEPGSDGEGYLSACKKISGSNIHYWGLEKNPLVLKYLYQKAKVTAIPSYSEMVPLVAFESLSQKTPVICTNRCGINGDIIPGLFFTGITKNDLAKSIIIAQEYNRNDITDNGIFSWVEIAKQYLCVYNIIIKS